MELTEIENLAIQLMQEHSLNDWKFEFDRAKRRNGLCSYKRKTISLSRILNPLRTPEGVKNTILHEIAHALVGWENGHNKIWKAKAIEIGCSGERCSSDTSSIELPGTYNGLCNNCGKKYTKILKPGPRSCSDCCRTFNPKYLLTLTLVK